VKNGLEIRSTLPGESLFSASLGPNSPMTLRSAIERFASMQCENPRDKVYGLLGLVVAHERPEVDCNKSLYEVYINTVRAMSQQYWGLRIEHASPHLTLGTITTYIEFAQHVGFSRETNNSLYRLFGNMREAERFMLEHSFHRDIQMEFQPALPSDGTPDRWWFEANGLRRYHDCLTRSHPSLPPLNRPF
jgi:hypothetical protein